MATPARSRQRQGTSAPTPRAPSTIAALPPYQPPTQSLNEAALQRLRDFSTTSSLGGLKQHLSALNNLLATSAADLNDRYADRAHRQGVKNARRQERDGDEETPGDAEAEAMRVRVQDLTAKLEEGVRAAIDAKARVDAMETGLKEVNENVVRGGGNVAPTQSTLGASQFRRNRRTLDDDDAEEDGENEETALEENQGLIGAVKRKIGEHDTKYSSLSMSDRYATSNPYINFKRLVHDSQTKHIEQAPLLPNAARWFATDQAASASTSQSQTATTATFRSNTSNPSFMKQAAEDDPESDIEVAGEKITIKCPLTLLPMQDPLTSTKCPHSFESEAILGMIKQSTTVISADPDSTQAQTQTQRRGARGVKGVKCPVCNVMLAEGDLHRDEVLVRKIRREQEKERRKERGDDWDEEYQSASRGAMRKQTAEEIGSSDVEDGRKWSQLPSVKAERASGLQRKGNAPRRTEGIEDDDDEESE